MAQARQPDPLPGWPAPSAGCSVRRPRPIRGFHRAPVQGFQQRKGHLQEEIQVLDLEIDNLKQLRKKTEHHIPVKSLPEEDRFTRLRTERKHFIDTLQMIAYRAESSMASLLGEHMARGGDDARALLRQIFRPKRT